jgi:hypothetical protein
MECASALATLQIVRVDAQQAGWDVNVSAMGTRPRRLRDVVVAFPGHQAISASFLLKKPKMNTGIKANTTIEFNLLSLIQPCL